MEEKTNSPYFMAINKIKENMTTKIKNSPKTSAFHDMSECIEPERKNESGHDVWTVTSYRLDTLEQRRLNRELGIHAVNKTRKNMGRGKN